jgi:putative ABC transport system substrate-binding protein
VNRPPSPLTMLLSRHTRRREVIALIGATTAAWPLAARAQHRAQVGFLHPGSAAVGSRITAVREGLAIAGGTASNAIIVPALAEGRIELLPLLAADLAARSVDVICAVSPPAVTAALSNAPATAVIAMDLESDPVANGWVNSLARPAGRLSGVFLDLPDFTAKCMQLLREAAPAVRRVAALWHPASGEVQKRAAQAAARALDIDLAIIEVAQPSDFEGAFATARGHSDGIFMLSSPLFGGYPKPLAQLALNARMPAVNQFPDFAEAGGFLAYGPELQDLFRRAGSFIGKVLNGAPVGDLPVERPTRFSSWSST